MRTDLTLAIPILTSFAMILLSSILIAIWVYRDAKAHGENGLMWLIIVILVPNALGLVLYLLLVKREQKKLCPNCGAYNPVSNSHCGSCGRELDQTTVLESQGSRLWIPALVLLGLAILLFIAAIFIASQQDATTAMAALMC